MSIQTLKVVDGRLLPSTDPYDASLIEVSKELGNAIQIKEDGLYVKVIETDVETILDPELDSRLIGLENTDLIHNQKIAALETSEATQDSKIAALETDLNELSQYIESKFDGYGLEFSELSRNLAAELDKNKTLASSTTGNTSTVTKTETGFEVFTPAVEDQVEVSSAATVPTNLENSLPLYTLGNNGEYILCQPDNWIKIGDNYIPSYSATTLGK